MAGFTVGWVKSFLRGVGLLGADGKPVAADPATLEAVLTEGNEAGGTQIVADGGITSPGPETNSEQFGAGSVTDDVESVAVGPSAATVGRWSTAVGYLAATSVERGTAIGRLSKAGEVSVAVGSNSSAESSGFNVAVGQGAACGGHSSVVIGRTASGGSGTIAVGRDASGGIDGVAIGQSTSATGRSVAIGRSVSTAAGQLRFDTTLSEFILDSLELMWSSAGLRHGGAGLVQVTDGDAGLGRLQVASHTVATAPTASPAGQIAYFSDGAAGSPVLAFSDGTDWLRSDTRAAVSSS